MFSASVDIRHTVSIPRVGKVFVTPPLMIQKPILEYGTRFYWRSSQLGLDGGAINDPRYPGPLVQTHRENDTNPCDLNRVIHYGWTYRNDHSGCMVAIRHAENQELLNDELNDE